MTSKDDVHGDGFEILGHEVPQSKTGGAEEVAPTPEPEEAGAAREGEALPPKQDVYLLLQMSVMQFASLAWQKMGLQADPFTNTMDKDIEQARVAIDAAEALVERLLPHAQGQQARDYQTLLTDLRLNFVRQSQA